MRRLRSFVADVSGIAAIEFAIVAPVMLAIFIGAVDLGLSVNSKMMLQSSVNAGLQHAMQTQGGDIETTKAVIAHAMSGRPVEIEAEKTCECAGVPKACGAPCSTAVRTFLVVSVTQRSEVTIFAPDMQFQNGFRIYTGKST